MKNFITFAPFVLLYFGISIFILFAIHNAYPHPYIDEEFHVPQAQKFCEGRYDDWDPKITTPPGLYAFTLAVLTPVAWLTDEIADCNIFNLRLINVLATTTNFLLLLLIKRRLLFKKNNTLALIEAYSLAGFPILYFFSFLYYTDAVSTMFVLAMYLMYLFDFNFVAASAGLMATAMRQTNIMWVAFFAAIKGFGALCEALQDEKRPSSKRKKSVIGILTEGLFNRRAIFAVIKKTFWYDLVGVAFGSFLYWNGSIVLGDKTAHEATFHLPQLFYFLSCVALFSPLHFIRFIPRFVQIVKKQKLQTLALLVTFLTAVHLNTLTHPYLLADNRHYTFYVWKRVFEAHEWAKYALCPLYVYFLYCINDGLKPQGPFVRYMLMLCIAATLIPQRLLEPRYFILPYLMIKLHTSVRSRMAALVDLAVAVIINAATVYIYVVCPFASDECVRFIW